MAKEVHLWMAGNDPFLLPVGELMYYIHAGVPNLPRFRRPASAGNRAGTGIVVITGTTVDPVAAIVAPPDADTADDFRRFLDGRRGQGPVSLIVDLGEPEEPSESRRLTSVLDGLGLAALDDAVVHLVPERPTFSG